MKSDKNKSNLVEKVSLVNAATPDPEHVVIRLGWRPEQMLCDLGVGSQLWHGVCWDKVGALGENRLPVYLKVEISSWENKQKCVELFFNSLYFCGVLIWPSFDSSGLTKSCTTLKVRNPILFVLSESNSLFVESSLTVMLYSGWLWFMPLGHHRLTASFCVKMIKI